MSFENNQIRLHDYPLYEETHYTMNHGDVARFETCIVFCIYIWRATGKHPYAKQMTRFLLELHFMYPERLRVEVRTIPLFRKLISNRRLDTLCDLTGSLILAEGRTPIGDSIGSSNVTTYIQR